LFLLDHICYNVLFFVHAYLVHNQIDCIFALYQLAIAFCIMSWNIGEKKIVKLMKNGRVAFQQQKGRYNRGLSLSKDAFLKMEDVSITPATRIELEPNVWLINYGQCIQLVKYCLTKDQKRCDGGIFFFTPKEWMMFWNKTQQQIQNSFADDAQVESLE